MSEFKGSITFHVQTPTDYPKTELFVYEDSETSKLLVKVCVADPDSNLDTWGMCRSLIYNDWKVWYEPSDRFYINYNTSCNGVSSTTPGQSTFCLEVYTKAGALFSVREESRYYPMQVTFRDKSDPPGRVTAFFNVTVVERDCNFNFIFKFFFFLI